MSSAEPTAYTTLEVAKHNTPSDAWIIVGGKVLNVTAWVDEHPGGDAVLLDSAGRDATREFEDVGHSADARTQLEKLVIGTIRPATEEELRISKLPGGAGRKKRQASTLKADVSQWVEEHSSQIKTAGQAAAAALVVVYISRRYIVPYLSGSNR